MVVSLFVEAKRHRPAVIFMPNLETWQATMPDAALVTFSTMLKSVAPSEPVLLLGTAETEVKGLPQDILKEFFGFSKKNRTDIDRPSKVSHVYALHVCSCVDRCQ